MSDVGLSDPERVERARLAKELQENRVLNEALDRMRDLAIETLEATSLRDPEGLAIVHQKLKVIRLFSDVLAGYVEDGKLALVGWDKAKDARKRRFSVL